MQVNLKAVLTLGVLLSTATIAAAAVVKPVYWTPGRMVKALTALNYGVPAGQQLATISCRGITPIHVDSYTGFRCLLGIQGQMQLVTVWARTTPGGRVCASLRSLAVCRIVKP